MTEVLQTVFYIHINEDNFSDVDENCQWVNVSSFPMRFFRLLGWYKRNQFKIEWVITPKTIKVNGKDWKVFFYSGHCIKGGKDMEKFRVVSQRDNLDL